MKQHKPKGLQQLVASNITELRKRKNILQKDLASLIGIKQKALSLIEKGYVDLPLSMLERIAVVLKMPMEFFLVPFQAGDGHDYNFVDKAKLLVTIDKKKLGFVLNLMDLFIDTRLEQTQ